MQALERLSQVMKALTPRHVDVVVCVAKKLKDNPGLQGARGREGGRGEKARSPCILYERIIEFRLVKGCSIG